MEEGIGVQLDLPIPLSVISGLWFPAIVRSVDGSGVSGDVTLESDGRTLSVFNGMDLLESDGELHVSGKIELSGTALSQPDSRVGGESLPDGWDPVACGYGSGVSRMGPSDEACSVFFPQKLWAKLPTRAAMGASESAGRFPPTRASGGVGRPG